MRIAVIGANGQLGSALVRLARTEGIAVEALTRDQLDVENFSAIEPVVASLEADLIFNCTAYNAVDKAEEDRNPALAINAIAPGFMAAAARKHARQFVHFSTDYVFGRGHDRPIDEAQTPDPVSYYGKTKRLGELRVLEQNPDALVIRTTGLYSDQPGNFVNSMLRLAREGRSLTVVNDQWISPTWVQPLAETSLQLANTKFSGIAHAVSHGGCTWFDLASKTFELTGTEADLSPISQKEWGAPAGRPDYSVLECAVLRVLGLNELASWDAMLEGFLKRKP